MCVFERLFSQIVESLGIKSLTHPELPDLPNKNTGSQLNLNLRLTHFFFSDKNVITNIAWDIHILKESLSET